MLVTGMVVYVSYLLSLVPHRPQVRRVTTVTAFVWLLCISVGFVVVLVCQSYLGAELFVFVHTRRRLICLSQSFWALYCLYSYIEAAFNLSVCRR